MEEGPEDAEAEVQAHKKRFWHSLQSVEKRLRSETEAAHAVPRQPISEQQTRDETVLSNLAHLLSCVDFAFFESMLQHAAMDEQSLKLQQSLAALRKLLSMGVASVLAALGVLLMTSSGRPQQWGEAVAQRLRETPASVFDELVAEGLLEEHTVVSSTLAEAVDLLTLSHTLGYPLHQAFASKYDQSPSLDVFQHSKHLFLFWLARLWANQARAAAEELCLFKINSLLPEVMDLASDDPKSLRWTGIAVQWTDDDTQACSKQFQEANLLQYLPASPIVEALLEVLQALERIAAGTQDLCRKSDLYVVCVRSFSLLLLRTGIPTHVLEICKPHRGHAYTRKIVCLCHIGSIDEAFNCAASGMDDVLVNHADQLHLEQRSLSLWNKLGRKNMKNQIPETPPRRSKQSYIERYLEIPRNELVRSQQSGHSRWKFQATQEAVSVLSACVLPRRRGIQGATFESFEPRLVSDGLCIEERVLCAYQTALGPGWKGMYGENRPWVMLFFLLCFDCIFDGSPLTTPREFVRTPLDLYSPTFYARRKHQFEERFKTISSWTREAAEHAVLSAWHRCQDCPEFVQEGRFEAADLANLAACVGGAALCTIFRHIARDYRMSSRGFPDLVFFKLPLAAVGNVRFLNKMSDDRFSQQVQAMVETRSCLLVEVKSPNDELSAYQRIWLNTLLAARLPAEVCYVSTPSVVIGR